MLVLTLTADLSGVTNLRPDDTEDNPFYYMLKVQCMSCWEVHGKTVGISRFEEREMSNSRGESNFVWKCKNCTRESSAMIRAAPKPYKQCSPPKKQNILEFECRGCEFVDFSAEGNWMAEGLESGTKFAEIDITDEWFEYDEKAGEEVTIKDIKWEIRRA
ncbi:uncharacterized protein H6S33_004589 [Morchella sextelata]|uniref:uncharacterized protein n=1 Tax=Morchella sextelata TaxID=1174677 RepID=UPI001D042931|nr:uncharacterized protein H6S33_004589 [Morchella sextelata]KAH0605367.1 hypothetical protein H6S33_004589 [Morchella sextelata]